MTNPCRARPGRNGALHLGGRRGPRALRQSSLRLPRTPAPATSAATRTCSKGVAAAAQARTSPTPRRGRRRGGACRAVGLATPAGVWAVTTTIITRNSNEECSSKGRNVGAAAATAVVSPRGYCRDRQEPGPLTLQPVNCKSGIGVGPPNQSAASRLRAATQGSSDTTAACSSLDNSSTCSRHRKISSGTITMRKIIGIKSVNHHGILQKHSVRRARLRLRRGLLPAHRSEGQILPRTMAPVPVLHQARHRGVLPRSPRLL